MRCDHRTALRTQDPFDRRILFVSSYAQRIVVNWYVSKWPLKWVYLFKPQCNIVFIDDRSHRGALALSV